MRKRGQAYGGPWSEDIDFAYAPFLEVLGTGLVTSGGDQWRAMRGHISKALRVEILDEIIGGAMQLQPGLNPG